VASFTLVPLNPHGIDARHSLDRRLGASYRAPNLSPPSCSLFLYTLSYPAFVGAIFKHDLSYETASFATSRFVGNAVIRFRPVGAPLTAKLLSLYSETCQINCKMPHAKTESCRVQHTGLAVTHSPVKGCRQIRYIRNDTQEWHKLQIFFASLPYFEKWDPCVLGSAVL
jgi:hypothetical protein